MRLLESNLIRLQWWLGLALLFCNSSAVAMSDKVYQVPSFTIDELRLGHRLPELAEALRTTGLFSVKSTASSLVHRSLAMDGLCHCLQDPFWSSQAQHSLEGIDSITLDDGITRRTTVATATIGNTPMPLTNRGIMESTCGEDTITAMEIMRDEVALVSDVFVKTLDRLQKLATHDTENQPLLETTAGQLYQTVESILQASNHLEHFHYYQKPDLSNEQETADNTMQWHTDAGLFLSFLPAWDCNSAGSRKDESFFVQLPNKEQVQANFEEGSVVIMMGAGAEHWLDTSMPLRATRHAVQMKEGDARTWYGMMHLVPESAIIQKSPERTFGDMKEHMKVSTTRKVSNGENMDTITIGCGPSTESVEGPSSSQTDGLTALPRRRLQHVQDASACNNVTNFFCWTQCLEISNHEQAESYITEGNSLYCLDPGILASTGNKVSEAAEPCAGKVHNSNCMGVWHPTSPSVQGWPVEYNSTFSVEPEYCYGGTSMYMDGFHWIHDTTCVIYLFPGWVLSSRAKFIAACIGTLMFGMMVELVIFQRRTASVGFEAGYRRLASSAAFYCLQLTMGYLIMLVVMTYSLPLFLCCVMGLVLGHVLFNAKDALLRKPRQNPAILSKETNCNGTLDENSGKEEDEENVSRQEEIPKCCSEKYKQQDSREEHGIPEGSTPCCQNTVYSL